MKWLTSIDPNTNKTLYTPALTEKEAISFQKFISHHIMLEDDSDTNDILSLEPNNSNNNIDNSFNVKL